MREKIENFVATVRAADESVKRFWTLTFSLIATGLVVALWVAYGFLFTLRSETAVIASSESSDSGQLATVIESARDVLQGFKRAADTTNNVKIVPEDRNLIFDELEPIPVTALP
jgi:hypothetical protein